MGISALVSPRKKGSFKSRTGESELLDLLFRIRKHLADAPAPIQAPTLNQVTRILVGCPDIRRAAIFRRYSRSGAENSKHLEFVCIADSERLAPEREDLLALKRSGRCMKKLQEEAAVSLKEIFDEMKPSKDFVEDFTDAESIRLYPLYSCQRELDGFLLIDTGSDAGVGDSLELFARLLADNLDIGVEREPAFDLFAFQEWLFKSFAYPVFLIDTRNKRVVKANRAVEKIFSADDAGSPSNLINLVESIVDKVNPRNPFVWCRAYLPNLQGDFYVVASSFTVKEPDHVCAALLPSNDKHWDFVRLLKKMAGGDLAAEAALKQLYWDRLMRQVVTRLHSSLDLNIVLQLLVDNLGQCLNASRCLFVKTDASSLVVSHEYSDPSMSPLGLGRTAGFPDAVVGLFRSGPLSLTDVTALRNGNTISGSDVSSMLNAGINSLAGAPLVCNGVLFGVLIVIEEGDNRDWTTNEMELIRMSARHAAVSVELCMEHQKVKDQLYHASTFRQVEARMEPEKPQLPPVRTRSQAKTELPHLSKRELEVLRLIASGLSNKEIAGRLFLTASTVELHASRMRKKLKMKSRTQLVKYACDHGLV